MRCGDIEIWFLGHGLPSSYTLSSQVRVLGYVYDHGIEGHSGLIAITENRAT